MDKRFVTYEDCQQELKRLGQKRTLAQLKNDLGAVDLIEAVMGFVQAEMRRLPKTRTKR